MTVKISPLLTIADLELMPDDGNHYELIEGELIITRPNTVIHQTVLGNLLSALAVYEHESSAGFVVPMPGVILDEHNSVVPDIVFLTDEQRTRVDQHIYEAPELAVEVVSPGKENARRDRVVKLQVYSKFRVKEYWVVDPEARTVEVYRLADDALMLAATLSGAAEVTSPVLPGFSCRVSEIFGSR